MLFIYVGIYGIKSSFINNFISFSQSTDEREGDNNIIGPPFLKPFL